MVLGLRKNKGLGVMNGKYGEPDDPVCFYPNIYSTVEFKITLNAVFAKTSYFFS